MALGRRDWLELFRDRWQVPVALAAVAVAGVTVARLLPAPAKLDLAAALADVALLEQGGEVRGAANAVANLLAQDPPLPAPEQAALHGKLAGLLYATEQGRETHSRENVEGLCEHQEAAWSLGLPRTPADDLRHAFAMRWLGKNGEALTEFRALDPARLPIADRQAVRRSLIELLEATPTARLERQHLLANFLDDDSTSDNYLWWALQRVIGDALESHDSLHAQEVLDQYGGRLATSDLKGYADYLQALILLHEGRAEQADPITRGIEEWLARGGRKATLDDLGHLPTLNRCLMGQIQLAVDQPQDALQAFQACLAARPDEELRNAAELGLGQALRRLYAQRRAERDFVNALTYLALQAGLPQHASDEQQAVLHEELGDTNMAAATATGDVNARRGYYAAAGTHFERAAALVHYDEPRLATLLWAAADAYDAGGQWLSARRVLDQFVAGRSDDPRMPAALLKLGQVCQSLGDLVAAQAAYSRLAREYPRLLESHRARVLEAGVLMAQGPTQGAAAEKLLGDLLEGEDISPDSSVFHDALLALCQLLNDQGRFGEAIARLDEARTRYPDDPERFRLQFMLADAYRHSAAGLCAAGAGGDTAAGAEGSRRLRVAADLYQELLDDLDSPSYKAGAGQGPSDADAAAAVYARLALFDRADCLYALNQPDTLAEALKIYRNAAARYAGQPAALTAHVQMANIHLQQGNVIEAARAIEKARWLLRSIPAGAFADGVGGTPADWERFLTVVSSSNLFREAFANPQ